MSPDLTSAADDAQARSLALFVLGLRCAMAEASGKPSPFNAAAFAALEAMSPEGEAEALFSHFYGFVRCLLTAAERPLQWRRGFCAHLCRDEWLAVALVEAGQRGDAAGLLGVAAELIGVEGLGDVLHAAQTLAFALARRGIDLQPRAACNLCPRRTLH